MSLIGLISDVHGEIENLRRALDVLANLGAEPILCMGDLVGKGPYPDAVVRLIMEREIVTVLGNHDQRAVARAGGNGPRRGAVLREETIAFLSTLPPTRTLTFEGTSLLMAHGSPDQIAGYVYLHSHPNTFRRVVQAAETKIVALGHTHVPMVVRVGSRLIVNPGSVCRVYSDGSGTCATLSLPSGRLHVYNVRNGQRVRVAFQQVRHREAE